MCNNILTPKIVCLPSQEHPLLLDSTLQSDLKIPALSKAYLRDFFVVMAICNTVVIHKDNCQVESQWSQGQFVGWNEGHGQNDDPVDTRSIVYEAESPDEAALVEVSSVTAKIKYVKVLPAVNHQGN